ncbi:unnamed protein product [Rotaria socialis]|uniref:Tudor domain-containing protein n=1 Tax=Rotaria socialis TaxID=392032 RepID=A0A820X3Y9_9BILA|nr:unnamed protein product [Rotaria socialis]CAF3670834.1 unnamed protein product [Rotaria socialis]CAF4436173.1 unnamed protein product [Rotaria socialis]CAF4523314.1 unnamed protein product [Rotaria socialis]
MNVKDQLNKLGWSVKMEFFEGNQQSFEFMKKQLLDSDIRHTGEKCLPEITKLDQTTKPYIIQLHKTRNVTAPKDNEGSSNRPHLYRLTITDGHAFQNAIVLPSLRNFNFDTPPGVKILLKQKTKVLNGFYILNDQTCEVLGGTVNELVHKWKLNKLMGKHVRTLIGEGAPPPWVPFGTRNASTTKVDTSKRSMDVAKVQQNTEEDPEFVRQRRAAIDNLLTGQKSKTQTLAQQNVMNGRNVKKCFEQTSQRVVTERPKTASAALSSSTASNKPSNMAASVEAIKANSRLPEWAKNQIADEPTAEDKRRGQSDRKPPSKPGFDDDDSRPRRGGGFGRNRRGGRGRDDDDGGEETRPSKDVTLFDFFGAKPASLTQKAQSKPQKIDPKPKYIPAPTVAAAAAIVASNQSQVSSAVNKQIFEFEVGDQVLARYYEDNEYYPAIVMSIMYETQKCSIMYEGFNEPENLNFDDIEPYEEGYYDEQGEYAQEQQPPPPSTSSQRNNLTPQYQQASQYGQSGYGYYNQQRDNQNRNRPNSSRGYPQQQQQQHYPNQYNNNNYY